MRSRTFNFPRSNVLGAMQDNYHIVGPRETSFTFFEMGFPKLLKRDHPFHSLVQGLRACGLGLRASGLGFRALNLKVRTGFGHWVSDIGSGIPMFRL